MSQPILPGLGLIGTILGVLVIPLAVWVWKIWKNDLKHINDRLERIEIKVDGHISDHAKGEFKE